MYPLNLTADEERQAGMIALVAINEGKTYRDRVLLAQGQTTITEYGTALGWLKHAAQAVKVNAGDEVSARVLLIAAAILADYYAQHIKEL